MPPEVKLPEPATCEDCLSVVAYLTTDEEGSPAMLFFDRHEAGDYCELGEEPAALTYLSDAQLLAAEVDRLRAEVAARDELLREVEQYMCNQPAVWSVLGLLKRIRAALDASRLALKEETK